MQLAAIGDATDAVAGVLGARRLGVARTMGTVASAGAAAAVGFAAVDRVGEGDRPT